MLNVKDTDKLKKEDFKLDNLEILKAIADAIADKSELRHLSKDLKAIVSSPKVGVDDLLKATSDKDKVQIKSLVEIIKVIFEDNQRHNKEIVKNIDSANKSIDLLKKQLERDVSAEWEMFIERDEKKQIEKTIMKRIR
tara:strand:- start:901 stop:1314 length:414 start_codon:yes stop_codon:yes gene_type:complete